MEDLGVIKEENKTKKWINSKVSLSLFLGEQKTLNRRGREEKKIREKVWNLLCFVLILVWKYGF